MNNNPNVLVKISNAGIHKNGKWLVKDVNLEIHRGKIVTIIGPNGSGKSTTAKIALGLFKSCLLYTSPSPRDQRGSRMPSSA